jgi:hypothetical protein
MGSYSQLLLIGPEQWPRTVIRNSLVHAIGTVLCMLFDSMDDFQSDSVGFGQGRQRVRSRGRASPRVARRVIDLFNSPASYCYPLLTADGKLDAAPK